MKRVKALKEDNLLKFAKHNIEYNGNEKGFSIIELIIVLLIVSILSLLSIMAFKPEKKFLADSEALRIIDVLSEARQRALTQHTVMRVEISKTQNVIRLINEKKGGDSTDDQIIKALPLDNQGYVKFDAAPTNMATPPTESAPVPAIVYKSSTHPLSLSEQVATLRFFQNGYVFDGGSNAIGTNATMTGATIFVWMPNYSESNQQLTTGSVIRGITVLGSTGSPRFLRCPVKDNQCTEWGT